MVRKHGWRRSKLILLALGVGLLSWLLVGTSVALAARTDGSSPANDNEELPVINLIRRDLLRNAPPPPLSKAYMGAPMILTDTDGDARILTADEKWIEVDLSEQKVIAFEGASPIRIFSISSGLPGTPTVTGTFRIRAKVRSQTMSGPGYSLPNVEWVQYFFSDYAFHGAYWHNNFGHPMSHGCINMTNDDAKWLFEWAGPEWNGTPWMHVPAGEGTLVVVHD